jgi:hypothetical protein
MTSARAGAVSLPYSLALKLRDAGVAADAICPHVNFEKSALDGLYRLAEAKLNASQGNRRPLHPLH